MSEMPLTCTVCLDDVAAEHASTLPCGHTFHAGCLVPWLWRNGSCPNCRRTRDDSPTPVSEEETDEDTQWLDALMRRMTARRLERRHRVNRMIRRANNGMTDARVVEMVRARTKEKERMEHLDLQLKQMQRSMRVHDRTIALKRKELYKAYLRAHRSQEIAHRQATRADTRRRKYLQGRMSVTFHRLQEYDSLLETEAIHSG